MSSQGAIQKFYYNGGEVGSIESATNTTVDLSIGSGNVRLLFFTNGSAIVPRATSNNSANGTIDLGNSGNKFKDLYLSNNATAQKLTLTKAPVGTFTIEVDGTNTGQPNLIVKKSTTEVLRIDNNKNLLVGKTSANNSTVGIQAMATGDINATVSNDTVARFNRLSGNGEILRLQKDTVTVGSIFNSGTTMGVGSLDTGVLLANNIDAILPWNASTNAERGSAIDLGRASTGLFKNLFLSGIIYGVQQTLTRDSGAPLELNRTTNDGELVYFKQSGVVRGSISISGSSTSYNTSSDYRLKVDVQPMSGATERLKELKPVNFAWKADGSRVDGFLAHEAQEVVPESVTGSKDAMQTEEYEVTPAVTDEEGNVTTEAVMGEREVPDYQGIDQSKLVPLLVATIQELEARITQLENN
jgi:hypothetical protein